MKKLDDIGMDVCLALKQHENAMSRRPLAILNGMLKVIMAELI